MCGDHFDSHQSLDLPNRNETEALPRSNHLELKKLAVHPAEQGLQIKVASQDFELYPLSEAEDDDRGGAEDRYSTRNLQL
jgi:hypothetical protein